MAENTITVPADLNGWHAAGLHRPWTPEYLRNSATTLERHGLTITSSLLKYLADEIERQAPRAEGWYALRRFDERLLRYWNGERWLYAPNGYIAGTADDDQHYSEITPVTIGRADS